MKRIVYIMLAVMSAVSLRAQTEESGESLQKKTVLQQTLQNEQTQQTEQGHALQTHPLQTHPQPLPVREGSDYLQEQIVSVPRPIGWGWGRGFLGSGYWGRGFFGMDNWMLHEGLNMNLGASVFGSWGGSKYLGTGVTQDVSMMYAMPLTNKLSVAVGGYFSNILFAHNSYRSAGLSGVLSYRFNDHWEAYVYGQKSLVETGRQVPFWGMGNFGDRIGAGVIYHVDPTLSFEVNVEYMHLPDNFSARYYDYRSPLTPTTHGAPPPPR